MTTDRNQQNVILEAALDLAAEKGWDNVELGDLAMHADITLADLNGCYRDKGAILMDVTRYVDKKVLTQARDFTQKTPENENETARDLIFDIMMARFDVLNTHREGYRSMIGAIARDPVALPRAMPALINSMHWMLEAAGVHLKGWRRAAAATGLVAIYIQTIRSWLNDESMDMSKTMATLDKSLAQAESWASNLGFARTVAA